MLKRFTFLLLASVLIGFTFQTLAAGQISQDAVTIERAKQLWEMAIAAKGGRDKLDQVRSLMTSNKTGTTVDFMVFPDFYFSWFDASPSKFGLLVEMFNFKRDNGYVLLGGKVFIDKTLDPKLSRFLEPQLYYLLETRWFKPEILRASKATIGAKRVDQVEVMVEEAGTPFRCGVFLDEKTHLPLRIGFYSNSSARMFKWVDLDEYQEVAGIKVPTRISGDNGKWSPIAVEINVDYEPDFFNHNPDLKAGPYQWRKRGAPNAPLPVAIEKQLKPEQINQYIKDLASADQQDVMLAMRELRAAAEQATPLLMNALTRNSGSQKHYAAVTLLNIDKENDLALKAMRETLLDSKATPLNRQQAAFRLMESDKGIPVLTELLKHPEVLVRRCVIFAFDELTELTEIPKLVEKAVPNLKDLLKDPDKVVRGMAEEILEQINEHKPKQNERVIKKVPQ